MPAEENFTGLIHTGEKSVMLSYDKIYTGAKLPDNDFAYTGLIHTGENQSCYLMIKSILVRN